MNSENFNCGACNKFLHSHLRSIRCCKCHTFFHVKCCNTTKSGFLKLQETDNDWACDSCLSQTTYSHREKCGTCTKHISMNHLEISCSKCMHFHHAKCAGISIKQYKKLCYWNCDVCTGDLLPFAKIDDEKLKLTLLGKDTNIGDYINISPSYTIQTLLDKIPGTSNPRNDDFLSDSIASRYFTPSEFLTSKVNKKSFSMLHINIASLSLHIDDLKTLLNLLDHPFDIIGVSETKIREDRDPITNIELDGYDFVHTSTKSYFGGVGIFVKSGHDYVVRTDLNKSVHNVAESVFIEIKHQSKKNLIVGCIYRHHSPITEFISTFLDDTLITIGKEKNKICTLLGDFNVDLLKADVDIHTTNFVDLLYSNGFRPLILQPSRVTSGSATLIDNIYINDLEASSYGGNITSSISDHFPQFCTLNIFEKVSKTKNVKYGRSFKHFNQNEFETELKNINWEYLFTNKNCDEKFTTFFLAIERLLDEMAPVRQLTRKEINLLSRPWITNGILKSIKDRDFTHKTFLKEKDIKQKEDIFNNYKIKRNLIKILIRQSKRDYYIAFFEEHKSDTKKTWEGIRNIVNISKKNRVTPVQVKYKNNIYTDKTDIATSFNDFFVGIGNSVEAKIPPGAKQFTEFLGDSNENTIFLQPVDAEEVATMIASQKISKACGPNSIPSKILKTNSEFFIEPLKHIINLSFIEGSFPNLLKKAEVCPIYKNNDKTKCENYRPISLLSNLSKLFERAMHTRLYNFIDKTGQFYDKQFGFRKKYSTNHALLSIIEGIKNNLDKKTFVCGVFIDLEKAFDTVNHLILLKKMEHYGIRGVANQWFTSYLSSRLQKVKIDNICSTFLDITCGVPQGSILGPLLFLIYINDMRNAVKHSEIHHFADDTNLLCSDKDSIVLRQKMNEDLSLIFCWLCSNRLSLNVLKTEFIIFKPPKTSLPQRITLKLNGTTLYESNKIKYLGIIMDDRLTWKHHITELSKKISKSIGIIFKMKNLCPQRISVSLYHSLVHSHLSYGACVWGKADNIYLNKIRVLQKKVVRIIANAEYNAHTTPIFKNLKILKLDDITKMQYACFMWNYDHGYLPHCFNTYFAPVSKTHNYPTRNSVAGKLSENILVNTKTHGFSMLKFIGPKILNSIKDSTLYKESKTVKCFRTRYKKHLLDFYEFNN